VAAVTEQLSASMLEFLEWVAFRPRSYADTMEAWGSHCPRFTLWEDALDFGLISLEPGCRASSSVQLTAGGRRALSSRNAAHATHHFPA
jgi:hypothetical protein